MNIHLKAQMTAADFAEAQLLHGKVARIYGTIGFAVTVAASSLLYFVFSNSSGNWVVSVVFGVLSGVIFYLVFPRSIKRRSAKTFSQYKAAQVTYDFELTDSHLVAREPERGEWKLPWTDFYKWKANEKIALIYVSARMFHLFPRRWFASEAEFQSFKDLLATTLGPAGKARKQK